MEELQRYGFENFSVRRIASQCGVSCAAPYKHFADKQTFISAIFEYINKQWILRQNVVLQNCQGPTRKKILELSMEYVRFLVEHAQFRSIIMMKYDDTDEKFSTLQPQADPADLYPGAPLLQGGRYAAGGAAQKALCRALADLRRGADV